MLPLTLAARGGRWRICRLLINAGADVNGVHEWRSKPPRAPLHAAAVSGSSETVRELLRAGADVDRPHDASGAFRGLGKTTPFLVGRCKLDPGVK